MTSSRPRASIPALCFVLAACATGACSSSSFAVADPRGGDDTGGDPLGDGSVGDSGAGSDTSRAGSDTAAKDSTATDGGVGGGDATGEGSVADVLPPVDGGPLPTIAIEHPGDSACWVIPSDTQVVRVSVTGWTLADLGTCAGKPRCGPVYVTLDGTNCDLPGLTYNTVIGASGSSDLQLSACKGGKGGVKTIRVELRNDDGSVFVPDVAASQSTDFTGPC